MHALFYADDLCIIAETERDLQTMLSVLSMVLSMEINY